MEILSVLGILAIVYVLGAIITFAIVCSECHVDSGANDPIEVLFMGLCIIIAIAAAALWPGVLWVALSEKFKKD